MDTETETKTNIKGQGFISILGSASKIVFIIMALSLVVLTFKGLMDPKDFMTAALMAFTFYFSNKGDGNKPFAGK